MPAFTVNPSQRIQSLPPYLFAEIDRLKEQVRQRGVNIIDLGVGDPDLPTPPHVIEKIKEACEDPSNHRYPSYEGMPRFRQAVSDWYLKRFNVTLDPEREIVTLIGSKEGIAHIPLALIDPGDVAIVPDPGYPVYNVATLFAGGTSHFVPLRKERGFLPDFSEVPESVLKKAKLLFINYPNNPTSAVAEREFFKEVIGLALRHNVVVAHDAAYTEVAFDGYRPLSFLQLDEAKDVGIEFHSLSKTYNMTGWRIGFAAGHPDVVKALGKVKTNIDSGAAQAIQMGALHALRGSQECVEGMTRVYQKRRDIMVEGLRAAGLEVDLPRATFYLWVQTPSGLSSADFSAKLLDEAGVVTTPGNGFGGAGEGYIRIALTVDDEKLQEAVQRIKKVL